MPIYLYVNSGSLGLPFSTSGLRLKNPCDGMISESP